MLFENTKKYLNVENVDKNSKKIKIKKQNKKSCEKKTRATIKFILFCKTQQMQTR